MILISMPYVKAVAAVRNMFSGPWRSASRLCQRIFEHLDRLSRVLRGLSRRRPFSLRFQSDSELHGVVVPTATPRPLLGLRRHFFALEALLARKKGGILGLHRPSAGAIARIRFAGAAGSAFLGVLAQGSRM